MEVHEESLAKYLQSDSISKGGTHYWHIIWHAPTCLAGVGALVFCRLVQYRSHRLTPSFLTAGIQDLLCERLTKVCKGHSLGKEEL